MDVGKNIKRCIKEKRKLIKYVADECGFTQQQMSQMISGRKVIRAEYIPGIARAIGVEIPELFREDT